MSISRRIMTIMWILLLSASCGQSNNSKTEPSVSADVHQGISREVLVVLDQQALTRLSTFNNAAWSAVEAQLKNMGMDADSLKARALNLLGSNGYESLTTYSHLPILHLRINSVEALEALEANPEVVSIAADEKLTLFSAEGSATTSPNMALINQPSAAAAGFLGANTSVAVLDTGTDYTRAPFNCTSPGAPNGCKVIYARDFAPDDHSPDTDELHGTNVSGIVLAVAPATKIVALDVFDGAYASTSTVLTAIDWCVHHQAEYHIVAMNMSFGGKSGFTTACAKDAFATGINVARAAGILTTAAAGNEGLMNAIASPACVPSAISVGAVYDSNVGSIYGACSDTTARDKVACFSNSASFLTLLAPGLFISAADIQMSGTSQSAPHVAGAIAVLRSAFSYETVDQTVSRLVFFGTPVKDARNGITKPRLDLWASIGGVIASPSPSPQQSSGMPAGQITINQGAGYTNSVSVIVNPSVTSGSVTHVCLSTSNACTAWQNYASALALTLPAGDGTKTVYAWFKDVQGNVSPSPVQASIILDSVSPKDGSLSVAFASAGKLTLRWSGANDTTSGIARYKLLGSVNGLVPSGCNGGTLLYSGTSNSFTAVLKPGINYFRLCALDMAGNTSSGVASAVVMFRVPSGPY